MILVIFKRREVLAFTSGHRAISLNERLHHATRRFNAQRQRRNVQEQHVLDIVVALARHDGSLHSCSIGHSFIWVDASAKLLATKKGLDELLHLWNSS
mmetsp:Transcript_100087/g.178104  ORF Transcript_100087/g.178104 Transcript_100087/m.178104 type:complete len:98 (+) Transcript_100087:714-1007(+)